MDAPASNGGMHAAWTAVGSLIDMAAKDRTREGETPTAAKLDGRAAGFGNSFSETRAACAEYSALRLVAI